MAGENRKRIEELQERVDKIEKASAYQKRSADEHRSSTRIVIEGSAALEQLYTDSERTKNWQALRDSLGTTLCAEVATQLGEGNGHAAMVDRLQEWLTPQHVRKARLLPNGYRQTDTGRQRKQESFVLVLPFGKPGWEVMYLAEYVIGPALHQKGDAAKLKLYRDKTEHERELKRQRGNGQEGSDGGKGARGGKGGRAGKGAAKGSRGGRGR